MARKVIGFIMTSSWHTLPTVLGETTTVVNGKFNGYVAIPNELIKSDWSLKETDFGYGMPSVRNITLSKNGDWLKGVFDAIAENKDNVKIFDVLGDYSLIDNTYHIFGWSYSITYGKDSYYTFDDVKVDVLEQIRLIAKATKHIV